MEAIMQLITDTIRDQLITNGRESRDNPAFDPHPVVKLFTPDAGATWLISECDPQRPDYLYGLCDLGVGEPELGSVSLTELEALRGPLGLPVERDLYFEAGYPLSHYAHLAIKAGAITA
ncbi:DUF2958 domain-containing protein [Sphingopyxis sp. 113P3]|uniref:DUF2958 domain-containing protein n=1 Tax=Sphingopyxis sp. (strain 113P3) TaxID=292913 RepID=UPI0006BD638B|nr:DUF2958 domain-containing protein [Sphingopyxis sp. 113P3]ALC11506.1 transposase [Sphingopyxis sp. 113P3]